MGYLVAGALLGPSVMNLVSDPNTIMHVAELDGRRIGSAFVDGNQARLSVRLDSFVQKTSGCLLITPDSQQNINGIAMLVTGAIEIFPVAFDVDVGLIKPPADWLDWL